MRGISIRRTIGSLAITTGCLLATVGPAAAWSIKTSSASIQPFACWQEFPGGFSASYTWSGGPGASRFLPAIALYRHDTETGVDYQMGFAVAETGQRGKSGSWAHNFEVQQVYFDINPGDTWFAVGELRDPKLGSQYPLAPASTEAIPAPVCS